MAGFIDSFSRNTLSPVRIDPEIIKKNMRIDTFHKWINKILPCAENLPSLVSLSDSSKLIRLIDILTKGAISGYSFKKSRIEGKTSKAIHTYNIRMCLQFLKDYSGISCQGIKPSGISDGKMSPILDLVWILILHFFIDKEFGNSFPLQLHPIKKLDMWLESKIGKENKVSTEKWSDGGLLGALVNAMSPDLCSDYLTWKSSEVVQNISRAMLDAQTYFDISPLITPAQMAYPQVDEMSAATYLSQFVNAKYKDPSNTLETEVNASDPKILRYGNEEEEEEKDEDDGDEGKKRKGKSSKRKNYNLEVGSKKKKAKLEKFEDEDDDNNVYDSSVKSESLQVQTQPINKRKRSSIKVEKDATTW